MNEIFIWSLALVASLIVLIKSSSSFTDSAVRLGLFFGIPAFMVGVTIVAIGTSLPELISSIIAVRSGSSEMVVGNVVGSNITNILLIFGTAAILGKNIKIGKNIMKIDLPLLISSTFLMSIMVLDGKFSLLEAILSIAAFLIFLVYTVGTREKETPIMERLKTSHQLDGSNKLEKKDFFILIITSFFIYLGAKFTVESVLKISSLAKIETEIVAITMVALGTSLPELVVTIVAAKKKRLEIVAGNILGSNIFNALAVMGIAALFGTLIIPPSILIFGIPMLIVSTLMFLFMTQEREITKWEGGLLLIFYIFFIVNSLAQL